MGAKLQELATNIVDIVKDYHSYLNFQFLPDRVIEWVNQFEENDRIFILEEFFHLLNQGIYFSESRGRDLLIKRLELLAKEFKFSSTASFLSHAQFLKLQTPGKSQDYLLNILEEELTKNYGLSLAQCGTASKKYIIYIDDVLATGGTVFKDTFAWLNAIDANGKSNLTRVLGNESILIISLFCRHNWPNIPWRLKLQLNNDAILKKIRFYSDYEIENHTGFQNQRLNFAFPIQNQPNNVLEYFNNIPAQDKANVAFRGANAPTKETLFSSPQNRIRFENIILLKGVELLQKAQALKSNHRPLGATFPSYKTLGTGTLFFTWRNISNTCPIVFWWDAGVWFPLFPLKGRGIGNITEYN